LRRWICGHYRRHGLPCREKLIGVETSANKDKANDHTCGDQCRAAPLLFVMPWRMEK
jgi:hypothetical protein